MPCIVEVHHPRHRTHGNIVALDGVSLKVHPGVIADMVGRNGVGKVTSAECIQGQYLLEMAVLGGILAPAARLFMRERRQDRVPAAPTGHPDRSLDVYNA